MIGLGIDAVDITRFGVALERTPRLATRLFTEQEREQAARRADASAMLAARFAVREATMKVLGVGLGAFDFTDVSVETAPDGRPSLRISGRAAELARTRGVNRWHVSLTHTDHLAVAVVAAD
ncbi:MAG: holo-ACP synthase [Actinomycetota bacterium]|jgi:holo-[acyl-carrier protein] synthase